MPTSPTLWSRLLAIALLVSLTGCRESLVTDLPDPSAPPAAPPTAAPSSSLYIKGVPDELRRGEPTTLRVQSHRQAVRLVWDIGGEGEVSTSPSAHPRELPIRGQRVGEVRVLVLAYDAAGDVVATGRRTFQVVL